ncbi:MAG: peptidoglycan-binding domain-containing protein [Alphaproteobacteria bacterium]
MQRRLTLTGYDTNGVDGVFGGGTRRAVSAWQSQNSLAASGYLDRAQYSLLISQTETQYSQWQANQRARQRMVPTQNPQPAPQPQPVQQQEQQPQQGMGAKDVVEGVKAARDILNIFGR